MVFATVFSFQRSVSALFKTLIAFLFELIGLSDKDVECLHPPVPAFPLSGGLHSGEREDL